MICSQIYRQEIAEIDDERICFYDIEANNQYSAYANISTIAVGYGFDGKPLIIKTAADRVRFRRFLADRRNYCVSFNGVNYDNIVLRRHGYPVGAGRQDLFFGIKVVAPGLAAFSQKFVAWHYFCDLHMPEMKLHQWCQESGRDMHEAPAQLLESYNCHDVVQCRLIFRLIWDVLIRDEYWTPYQADMEMAGPLEEMILEGGVYVDRLRAWKNLQRLQKRMSKQTRRCLELTNGQVENPNSSKQVGEYLNQEKKIELKLSDDGNFSVPKKLIVALRKTEPLADCVFRYREAMNGGNFMSNYLDALDDHTHPRTISDDWIPGAWSVNSAKTRRFTSGSLYGINFQNANELCYEIQRVPEGYLGMWDDATQIENVVHIYESDDWERRAAYEADPEWSEYVWLCNRILGGNRTKKQLEAIPSEQIPNWSVYKHFKTGKLALNFGMGVDAFCELFGLSRTVGWETIQTIHQACPAIRSLVSRVKAELQRVGYVEDVFGWRYAGPPEKAYKVVAYMIQGCGTASLPKKQLVANWKTYRSFDRFLRGGGKGAICAGTTHDENGAWIDLRLGPDRILQLLQKVHYNMTKRFSGCFNGIPLRSKLYLSRTTRAEKVEVDITDEKSILAFATA